jgi:hypothetical protein
MKRLTGAGGVQAWVDVYLTSRQGYTPYTPDGLGHIPNAEVECTTYDRHNVKIWSEFDLVLPRIRAGEKVPMLLSGVSPKAKRIVIHLKRE